MRYKSIVLEGGEACGKSTILKLLEEEFKRRNLDVSFYREPGSTDIGEQIRKVLLDKENTAMTPKTEMFLFAAARNQLLTEKVLPDLEAGKIVVLDRSVESSYVYQGYIRGEESVFDVNEIALEGFKPDVVLFLDLPIPEVIRRLQGRPEKQDRFDAESTDFMFKVRGGYLRRAIENPAYKIIDASKSVEEVFEQVKQVLF